jgi:hypothetical protein
MDRHGSAARTGRAEIAEQLRERRGMEDVTGGDPDVDSVDAFFTGEESARRRQPTPDQDIVDDIGKALGVQYEDNEELKSRDKLRERDKHRWELDPASSDDYKGPKVGTLRKFEAKEEVTALKLLQDDLVDPPSSLIAPFSP